MVLSLAFILAFIGASVALVIGILIFSEVTEAMALTLPEILVEIPTTPEVEGLWQLREHCVHAFCSLTNNAGTQYYSHEYRLNVLTVSLNGFDGVVKMTGAGGAPRFTGGQLFKVFDKDVLDGKLITWETGATTLNSINPNLKIYDGALDPTILTFNGSDVAHPNINIIPPPACSDCFPDTVAVITSGSGTPFTILANYGGNPQPTPQHFTGTPNLSSFDSPTGKVTLVIFQGDANQSTFMGSEHYQVTIADHGTYRFKSDTNDPAWNGATLTCISVNSCTTSSAGLKEESTWSVTSRPPPPLPVFNSPDVLNANEAFNTALNIGFTVLGVLPVALFFFLFAIFGGRLE